MSRIEYLSSLVDNCNIFADIGCDHGYCTKNILGLNLCNKAIITDISPKSLKKAEVLLADYIKSGKCKSVCCDGLCGITEKVDSVLIAGMGGEEIIKILKNAYIPDHFVLQPMKNVESVRKYLLDSGCYIEKDDLFFDDGKYYFFIKGGTYASTNALLTGEKSGESADGTTQKQVNTKPTEEQILANSAEKQVYTKSAEEQVLTNSTEKHFYTYKDYSQIHLTFGKDSVKNPLLYSLLREELKKKEEYLSADMSEKSRNELLLKISLIKEVLQSENN